MQPAKVADSGFATHILPYVVLFSVSFALYAKSMTFDFIPSWDDDLYVVENPLIREVSADHIRAIFTTPLLANYAPLHILSYALDFTIWGLNPLGFHLTNILLHSLNSCGLYLLLGFYTQRREAAFVAALIFALHPVNVENIAWVSERKTLLAAFFFFGTLWTYLNFRRSGKISYYGASCFLYACALLSKASIVILPLLLIATDRYFPSRNRRWGYLFPYFLLSAAGTAIVLWAHAQSHAIEEGAFSLRVMFGAVLPTMIPVFWKYVGLLLWPMDLSGFYDTTIYRSFAEPVVILSLAAWILTFIMVFLRGTPRVKFWFLWFWISLLPVSNIVPLPVYYADRYMYIPMIAFAVLAAVAIVEHGPHWKQSHAGITHPRLAVPFHQRWKMHFPPYRILVASFLILLACLSFRRLDVWSNEVTFWEDTVKKSPGQYKPHFNLGVAYERLGKLELAKREYEAAYGIYPTQEVLFNLSIVQARERASNQGTPKQ